MKITEELKLQMEGVISEYHKMNTSEKYTGILFKFGNVNVLICRNIEVGLSSDETFRESNFIFILDKEYTFVKEDDPYYGVLVSLKKVKPFIITNMKLFPIHFPDINILLKPTNMWSNKEMKTKKDREYISKHLCSCLSIFLNQVSVYTKVV